AGCRFTSTRSRVSLRNFRRHFRANLLSFQTFTTNSPHAWRGGDPLASCVRGGAVTQRCIEVVIGRLVTDEDFRQTFVRDPRTALAEFLESGTHLSDNALLVVMATDTTRRRRLSV